MSDLIARLCRCLAVQTESNKITLKCMDAGADPDLEAAVREALPLIAEAGHDMDTLFPPEHRPIMEAIAIGPASLRFDALRSANIARLPTFKNARGEPAHSEPDGSDWALSGWSNAVLGELGEAANIIKKVERQDMTLDEARPALAKEFADVQTYLDILAFRAGVNLGAATIDKFNEVSVRVGSPVRLREEGFHMVTSREG